MQKEIMPPTYLFLLIIAAVILHLILPIKIILKNPYNFIGILPVIVGILLNLQADGMFKKSETTVKPYASPSELITSGPFKYSRHPMYLGMIFISIGCACLLGSIAAFIPSIILFFILEFIFIHFEEKELKKAFGNDYEKYMRKVRKWI